MDTATGDGIAKLVGGFTILLALCFLASTDPEIDLKEPGVHGLIASLLSVPTFHAEYGAGSEAESKIGSIAKQNVNSKVEMVTSFEWSVILRSLVTPQMTFQQALQMYNNHPDVLAFKTTNASTDDDDDDAGLSVGVCKLRVIQNWFERTPAGVINLVKEFLHESYGSMRPLPRRCFVKAGCGRRAKSTSSRLPPRMGWRHRDP